MTRTSRTAHVACTHAVCVHISAMTFQEMWNSNRYKNDIDYFVLKLDLNWMHTHTHTHTSSKQKHIFLLICYSSRFHPHFILWNKRKPRLNSTSIVWKYGCVSMPNNSIIVHWTKEKKWKRFSSIIGADNCDIRFFSHLISSLVVSVSVSYATTGITEDDR